MWFSQKYKAENEQLKALLQHQKEQAEIELQQASDRNKLLEAEISGLQLNLKATEQITLQQLSGAAMLEAIRVALLQNFSSLSDEKQSLVRMSEVFSHTRQAITHLSQQAAMIRNDAEHSAESVRLLGQSSQSVN